jgi:hypothetical protein
MSDVSSEGLARVSDSSVPGLRSAELAAGGLARLLTRVEVRLCTNWDKVRLLAFTMRESAKVLTRNGVYGEESN